MKISDPASRICLVQSPQRWHSIFICYMLRTLSLHGESKSLTHMVCCFLIIFYFEITVTTLLWKSLHLPFLFPINLLVLPNNQKYTFFCVSQDDSLPTRWAKGKPLSFILSGKSFRKQLFLPFIADLLWNMTQHLIFSKMI